MNTGSSPVAHNPIEKENNKVEYLILNDIETDEEINRVELKVVRNISVMKGKEINEVAWMYGCHADNCKEYIMIQFTNKTGGLGFIVCEKSEGYISFK